MLRFCFRSFKNQKSHIFALNNSIQMSEDILDSNPTNFSNPNPYNPYPQPLPNATATLVLGICSIVGSFCYGIPGIICGIIALVISKEPFQMYKEHPMAFTGGENLRAGRICAIIGLSISGLFLLVLLAYLAFIGTLFYGMSKGH
jgi:M penetrans paralogue family 26